MQKRVAYSGGAVGSTIDTNDGGEYQAPKRDRCRHCGKPFRPTDHQPVFCSYDCEMAFFGREVTPLEDMSPNPEPAPKPTRARKPGEIVDICDVCGHPYIRGVKNQAWCSAACAQVAWSHAVIARRSRG